MSVITTICLGIIAAIGIFGALYDPGHPWLDRRRKVGLAILCVAGVVGLVTILVSHT